MSNFTTWRSLVDGEEILVIPDSAVAHYVADDYDEENGVWPDRINNYDLTGSGPTLTQDGIGGEPAVEFQNSGDVLVNTDLYLQQPATYLVVLEIDSVGNDFCFIFTSSDDDTRHVHWFDDSNDAFRYRGDSNSVTGEGPADDTTLTSTVFDGSDSLLRQDRDQTTSGDPGSSDQNGFRVGADDEGGQVLTGRIAEIRVYDVNLDQTGDLESEEDSLWGRYVEGN